MASLEVNGGILKCVHKDSFEEVVIAHIVEFYATNKNHLEIKTTNPMNSITVRFDDKESIDKALTQLREIF